ncbi:MAG: hypothetical protein P8J45_10865 [Phycisphaerales bacterium]|nr:hypothetical protein [Phycisphaerales bacterium]
MSQSFLGAPRLASLRRTFDHALVEVVSPCWSYRAGVTLGFGVVHVIQPLAFLLGTGFDRLLTNEPALSPLRAKIQDRMIHSNGQA